MSETEKTPLTLQLVSLRPNITAASFFLSLAHSPTTALIAAKVIRWIIPPTAFPHDSTLHTTQWDILLIFTPAVTLLACFKPSIRAIWTCTFSAPSDLVSSYGTTMPPSPRTLALDTNLTSVGPQTQTLELTSSLQEWLLASSAHTPGPVSLLSLLAFTNMPRYDSFISHWTSYIALVHAAQGKIHGPVLTSSTLPPEGSSSSWERVGLVHYPSLAHFGDMLASAEYQSINEKYRKGSLIDNALLCAQEVDLGEMRRASNLNAGAIGPFVEHK